MNKKGITLVELLLVIVIIGILSFMVIPNIMEALNRNKAEGGESIEKLLEKNLELYNKDNEEDIWSSINNPDMTGCFDGNTYKCVKIEDLYESNPDIDMGECLLKNDESLLITRDENGKRYKYSAKIICIKNSVSVNNKIATDEQLNSKNIYYETP